MLLRRSLSTRISARLISTSYGSGTKVPTLYKSPDSDESTVDQKETVTLQVLSWGRGASGQLGGGIEEMRLYPAPVANLIVSEGFNLSQTSGRLKFKNNSNLGSCNRGAVEIGISCGLFHSGLVVDGKFWVWGKGDGGRLGFGHENSAFVPTLNPYFEDPVHSTALGGMHSVALTSLGRVFTWSVLTQLYLN